MYGNLVIANECRQSLGPTTNQKFVFFATHYKGPGG